LEKKKIKHLAKKYGWKRILNGGHESILVFDRMVEGKREELAVYPNAKKVNVTVETIIIHPRMGKTKLVRKDINRIVLEKIFQNPRYHTGRGEKSDNRTLLFR